MNHIEGTNKNPRNINIITVKSPDGDYLVEVVEDRNFVKQLMNRGRCREYTYS